MSNEMASQEEIMQMQQGLNDRVELAEKVKAIEKKHGREITEQEFMDLLEKVQKYQDKDEVKKKVRKIKKNTMEDDFAKGAARNQPCPMCGVKLKKCKCGFLMAI